MMQNRKIDVLRRDHDKHDQPRQVPKDGNPTDPSSQQPRLEQSSPNGCLRQECQDNVDDKECVDLLLIKSRTQNEALGCHHQDPREQVRRRARSCQKVAVGIAEVSFEQHESDGGENDGCHEETPFPHEKGGAGWGAATGSTPNGKQHQYVNTRRVC